MKSCKSGRYCLQVVECRRILKWTYAYGYYSFQPAEERRKGAPPVATKEQQGFFEFNQVSPPSGCAQTSQFALQLAAAHVRLRTDQPRPCPCCVAAPAPVRGWRVRHPRHSQLLSAICTGMLPCLMRCCHCVTQGQAESYLERLHKMVENDLNEFIEGSTKVDAWAKWRENLIGLTDVTRSHFSKLVMELEKGLDAMLADYQNGAYSHNSRLKTSWGASPGWHALDCVPPAVEDKVSIRNLG